jgi:hypothetical protein
MSKTLHILNGDATLSGFKNAGLNGDIIFWREVFSQGPLTENLDATFWKARAAFISETFNVTTDIYLKNIVEELGKLNNNYSEINLWFEFDLHCQANMLGVINLLNQQADLNAPVVYLICPDCYPGIEDFRGMGQLDGTQLEYLFDDRIQLAQSDFEIAEEAWKLYVASNIENLKHWLDTTDFWGNLLFLKPALEAHIKRIAVNEQGLNYIEQKLFDIYNSGVTDRSAIYNEFWSTEKIYGMGDAEIDIYLRNLSKKQLIAL